MAIAYGDPVLLSLGLLLMRVIFGLAMVGHGAQKLFGWFGGYGLAGTGGFFESLGFRPGHRFAAAAAVSEFVGGWLLALGLFGPVGPALILAVMLVASISVHLRNGFFATTNGVELPLLIATRGRRNSAHWIWDLFARCRVGPRHVVVARAHRTGARRRDHRRLRQSSAQKKADDT